MLYRVNQYHEDLLALRQVRGLESFQATTERMLLRALREALSRQVGLIQEAMEGTLADLEPTQPYLPVQRIATVLSNLILIAETPLPAHDTVALGQSTGPPRKALEPVTYPCSALATSLGMMLQACVAHISAPSNQTVFLINNLDCCLQCFMWLEGKPVQSGVLLTKRDSPVLRHPVIGTTVASFVGQFKENVDAFASSLLACSNLDEVTALSKQGHVPTTTSVRHAAVWMHRNWKHTLAEIHEKCISQFSCLPTALAVAKLVFARFLEQACGLAELVSNDAALREIVVTPTMVVEELKRFRSLDA